MKLLYVVGAVCGALLLLGVGLLFAAALGDPSSDVGIRVQLPPGQLNARLREVESFVDSELLRRGFSRDQQEHDVGSMNWVTSYSYPERRYETETAVLASGCKVHETDFGLQIELSELGVMRPTQQFRKIRTQLREALAEKYGRTTVK